MAFISECTELDELGGRRFRRIGYIAPIAYRVNGSLNRIVSDWSDGDANFPHVVTGAGLICYTAADGMRRLCPTGEPTRYLEIGAPYIKPAAKWNKVNLGAPTRTANCLTWTTAQADVNIWHGGHFVKLAILLKGGWQPPSGQFAFPVGMAGLTRTGGNIYRDGVLVAMLRAPHVEDAANSEDVRPIAWDFVTVSGQAYILFTLPDLTGMTQPLIDPTLTLPDPTSAGKDTYLAGSAADTNYGTANVMHVQQYSTTKERSLIEFDLSGLPAGATLSSATLNLTLGANANATHVCSINRILAANDWVEAEATWNNRKTGTAWAGSVGCSTADTDYDSTDMGTFTITNGDSLDTKYAVSLNLTEFAEMVTANRGLLIRSTSAAATLDGRLATSDNITTSRHPTLVIEYTAAAGNPWYAYVQQ